MKSKETPPFAPTLMESTRAIGYSLEAAIADIVDNSIAAKSGKVQISFFPIGDAYVCILDDGAGMDAAAIDSYEQELNRMLSRMKKGCKGCQGAYVLCDASCDRNQLIFEDLRVLYDI